MFKKLGLAFWLLAIGGLLLLPAGCGQTQNQKLNLYVAAGLKKPMDYGERRPGRRRDHLP
ncbi:MAG TPA: hypothetical protein DD719_04740 [Desulfotomaculum sp.]|jgi:ABC-type molybdate transport system substrate-binding protein|nr:hypothetical protein [Desulfotomaculum sp.]